MRGAAGPAIMAGSGQGTVRVCRSSLRRLNTDRLDLYLLHSRCTPSPLEMLQRPGA